MSVSMKSTKAAMYSEIERLRTLCDQLDQSNRALRAESEERKAKSEEQPAEPREVTLSKMEIGKRLAILMKRTVRNGADGTFESFVDGEWITVPQRVVRHACGAA